MGAVFEWCSSPDCVKNASSSAECPYKSLRPIPCYASGEKQVCITTESMSIHYMSIDLILSYCRLLKKLREKDAHQIELEKREQGFALYLNGANLSQTRPHPQAPPSRKSRHPASDINHQQANQKRPSKTAGHTK